ncbi:unnamed protein product [Ectocarpus sp. CCAP 1310/34]|nr:unnamed protein product [Ectocarpus sp. CCAP 1310/34]
MPISFLCAEADTIRKADGHYTALGLLEGAVLPQYPGFAIKGGGSRWRRAELGWLTIRRENFYFFQTKNLECNEGESEKRTGKDSNDN